MDADIDDDLFDALGEGSGFRLVGESEGWSPKWLIFECPRTGRDCRIALSPNQRLANGASWQWDGDREKPTITPSVNCGGCGWHGFIRRGELHPPQ